MAFDREGDALLVWVRVSHEYPHPRRVQIMPRSRTGAWGSIVTLSPSGQAPHSPKVALDDDGDAVVAWHGFDGTDNHVVRPEGVPHRHGGNPRGAVPSPG